jgi:hypothetical protein
VAATVFSGGEGLKSFDTLDLYESFTQDHFTTLVLSDLKERARNLGRRKKSVGKMRCNHMIAVDYSPHSLS